jgi:general secretion pathway protein M
MRRFALLPVATQKLVAGLVVAAVVIAGSALSWQTHRRAAAAQVRLDASVANHEAMTALVQRFQAAQVNGTADTDVSAVVTRSLQGKSFQPSRIQQQAGEVVLRLDNAPFEEVLAWMLELEESGAVALGNVGITQAQPTGVTVTLVLRGG